ncbi:hypothetical protein ACUW6H_000540 [Streptococcus sp. 151470009-6]
MLIKYKEFIQKYWISILISWFFIWLWMAYCGLLGKNISYFKEIGN